MIDWSAVPQELVSEDPPWDGKPEGSQVPAQVDPFDLRPIRAKFMPYSVQVDEMVSVAKAHQVTDEASNKTAVEMAGSAKKLFNQIEAARKEIVQNPNDFIRSVNGLSKDFTDKLKGIEDGLKQKISTYQYNQELERRKQAEAARKAAEELQKKLDAEAKAANVEPVIVAPPIVPAAPKVTRTETGAAHMRMIWTFEIEASDLVPREYMTVDEIAVRRAVMAGIREIPGIRIFEKPTTTIRS